jgi:UDP-N-acetyl-2-amino-2-deoxyglucuronate dehydrogenase
MVKKFKCAVIAVGGRGKDHVSWLKANSRAEIIAVCDIDTVRVKKIAESCGAKPYTNYKELIDTEKLDAIFIASPHYLHAPMTIYAADHDINVFCEKPMATTLIDSDAMISACRKNGVKLAIGLQLRYEPALEYLYNAVRGAKGELGDLGRITDIYLTARHYRGELYYVSSSQVDPSTGVQPGPWRGRWQTEGAGILINQAIHNIDILRYVCGPFRSLNAYGSIISSEHKFIEVEDTVGVSFELDNGALGTAIFSSANAKEEKNRLVIHGTKGHIIASGGYGENVITLDTRYKSEEDYEIPFYTDPKRNQIDNFFDAIELDKEPMVNGEEGRKSLEIVRAILKSIQNEGRVHFPLHDSLSFPMVHNVNREAPPEM